MPEYGIDAILLFMKFICSDEHGSPASKSTEYM